MRRIDKETFKAFKINGLMSTYEDLTRFSAKELEAMWAEFPWPKNKKTEEICEALLKRAYKTVRGREKRYKKSAPTDQS